MTKSISQHVYRILFLTNHHIGGKCYASYFLKELGRIVSASNFSDILRHHFHTGTLQINIRTFWWINKHRSDFGVGACSFAEKLFSKWKKPIDITHLNHLSKCVCTPAPTLVGSERHLIKELYLNSKMTDIKNHGSII